MSNTNPQQKKKHEPQQNCCPNSNKIVGAKVSHMLLSSAPWPSKNHSWTIYTYTNSRKIKQIHVKRNTLIKEKIKNGHKTIKEFGNDEDSYTYLLLHSLQLQPHFFAAQAHSFFRPRPNRFTYSYTVAIASSARADMFCNGRSRGGGWERIWIKNPKILD